MNKGRYSNSNRVNLEAKPRSYHSGKYTSSNGEFDRDRGNVKYNRSIQHNKHENDDMTKKDKFIIKTIISAIIVIGIFSINNLNTNFSKGVTEEISKAISYQVQWNTFFKSDIIKNYEEKVATILGGKEIQVFNDSLGQSFLEPVNGHIISEFKETTHPVFNTKIEPRGIEYSLFEDQPVVVSIDGVVINIMDSTYQGKRVVVQHQDQYKTVYDGVEICDVKEGQSLKKGDKIGSISANEEISKMFFYEVWKDNVAVDPKSMLSAEK